MALRFFVYAVIFSFATLSCQINAFSTRAIHQHIPLLYTSSSLAEGFGKNSKPSQTKSSSKQELFELQELRAQLQTITDKNMLYQSLSTDKRNELTKYINAIIDRSDSPIDVTGKVNALGPMQFVAGIENKSWRMVFSTNTESDGSEKNDNASELPYGSTVVFRIGELNGAKGSLDYVLKFSKQIMGLKELVAKSICEIDIGSINPGLLTFKYEDIKTNIFGMSNLPVGFFGLLKGRVNYVDTIWFDGERWIERNYLENGDVVYSVYVRDLEDETRN